MIRQTIAAVVVGACASIGGAIAGPIGAETIVGPGTAIEPAYHRFSYRRSYHRGPCWQLTFWGNYRYVCADSNRNATHQY